MHYFHYFVLHSILLEIRQASVAENLVVPKPVKFVFPLIFNRLPTSVEHLNTTPLSYAVNLRFRYVMKHFISEFYNNFTPNL